MEGSTPEPVHWDPRLFQTAWVERNSLLLIQSQLANLSKLGDLLVDRL